MAYLHHEFGAAAVDDAGEPPHIIDGLAAVEPPLPRHGLALGTYIGKLRYHRPRAAGRRFRLPRYRRGRRAARGVFAGAQPRRRPDKAVFHGKYFIIEGFE
ncbi:hypothetical protein SDC9_183532 [bioreactor metagenome]|uniref:Uncharacterized protein n=1 Tax=bioreactor metagenome TaxID=1076179 RepID=A0A645HAG4_9ZZZZ